MFILKVYKSFLQLARPLLTSTSLPRAALVPAVLGPGPHARARGSVGPDALKSRAGVHKISGAEFW